MSSAYESACQEMADTIAAEVNGVTVQRTYVWTYDAIAESGIFVFVGPGMASGETELRRLDETMDIGIAVCQRVNSLADSDAILSVCETIIAAIQNRNYANFAYEGHRLAPVELSALQQKNIHVATITAQTRRNAVL